MTTPGKPLITPLATTVYLQDSFLPSSLAKRQVAPVAQTVLWHNLGVSAHFRVAQGAGGASSSQAAG